MKRTNQIHKVGLSIAMTFFFIISLTIDSQAIPSFARKYKTSCVTCHTVFPKLNSFGEAYRINGYQFPEDEEGQVKEEPVRMGSDAYKRVWPNAVWPNTIPATTPLAFRGRMGFALAESHETEETISGFGLPALQLIAAGTMGENISLFVGAHMFESGESGSIDRFFLKVSNMFTSVLPDKLLSLRFGQFIPEIVPFASNHRGLTQAAYAFNTYAPTGGELGGAHAHGGAGPFGIENFQLGTEASGVFNSRIRYVAGLVNGNGIEEDDNSLRDYYGRLSYKLGGMAYDGSGLKAGASNDRELSCALGVFGYKGVKTHEEEDVDFNRIGLDFNVNLSSLNLYGGIIKGEDAPEENEKYNLYFVQADYSIYPWLMGVCRYEQANPNTADGISQIVANVSALYVANIKFLAETRLNPDDMKFDNLYIGMDFGF
jgi:hypothetical protein